MRSINRTTFAHCTWMKDYIFTKHREGQAVLKFPETSLGCHNASLYFPSCMVFPNICSCLADCPCPSQRPLHNSFTSPQSVTSATVSASSRAELFSRESFTFISGAVSAYKYYFRRQFLLALPLAWGEKKVGVLTPWQPPVACQQVDRYS